MRVLIKTEKGLLKALPKYWVADTSHVIWHVYDKEDAIYYHLHGYWHKKTQVIVDKLTKDVIFIDHSFSMHEIVTIDIFFSDDFEIIKE